MSTPPDPGRVAGTHRSGLVTFAGIMLILAGSFNILDGIVALADDERFNGDGCCSATSPPGASGGCSSACCRSGPARR